MWFHLFISYGTKSFRGILWNSFAEICFRSELGSITEFLNLIILVACNSGRQKACFLSADVLHPAHWNGLKLVWMLFVLRTKAKPSTSADDLRMKR